MKIIKYIFESGLPEVRVILIIIQPCGVKFFLSDFTDFPDFRTSKAPFRWKSPAPWPALIRSRLQIPHP